MRKLLLVFVMAACAIAQAQIYGYSVASNGNDHLYRIDMATGAATDLGLVGNTDAEGVSFGPGNRLYAAGGSAPRPLWDITNPPGSLVGNINGPSGIDAGLGYDWAGQKMYYMSGNLGNSVLWTVDLATAVATQVGPTGIFADNIAFNAAGQGYAIDGITTDALYMVNKANGATTMVGSGLGVGNLSVQFGCDFGPNGVLYALDSAGQIYTINTATGLATLGPRVSGGSGFEGLAVVHEPTSLFLLAVAALVLRRR